MHCSPGSWSSRSPPAVWVIELGKNVIPAQVVMDGTGRAGERRTRKIAFCRMRTAARGVAAQCRPPGFQRVLANGNHCAVRGKTPGTDRAGAPGRLALAQARRRRHVVCCARDIQGAHSLTVSRSPRIAPGTASKLAANVPISRNPRAELRYSYARACRRQDACRPVRACPDRPMGSIPNGVTSWNTTPRFWPEEYGTSACRAGRIWPRWRWCWAL